MTANGFYYVTAAGGAERVTPYVTDSSGGEELATHAGAMPWGSPSVSAMLASSPFYWAHRGGSAIWPEMSLWAYTQSVAYGVNALEVSLARTKDGVWFGLHDETINRTSPDAPANSVASQMTWEQVQQYKISYRHPHQPYMRLEEVCRAYGRTHVLILDPKYAFARSGEMFDIALANGAESKKLVGKWAGFTTQTGLTAAAAARGIPSWGFYYADAIPTGSIPQYQAKYDWLGMEWNASQPDWDYMKTFNKPLIGHICATRSAADMALARGAVGVQVSGIENVMRNPL